LATDPQLTQHSGSINPSTTETLPDSYGEMGVRGNARAETRFHFRTGISSVVPWLFGLRALNLARYRADGGQDQRLSEDGDSSPSSRARSTAPARLCTPSLAYMLRRWALIVLWDTNSSAAISGARRLVGR
jgi:hypothetical protein